MKHTGELGNLRERGYEALFLLGAFAALSFRPTVRHAIELEDRLGAAFLRRRELAGLEKRGFVEPGGAEMDGVLRLTRLGKLAFAGGRDPEDAWTRPWDGQWRLVIFDLPRDARAARAKFWRWLRSHHFGRFQGSVWISPDPIPEIAAAAREAGLEDSMLTVFTGQVDNQQRQPRKISGEAWDFDEINERYGRYLEFGARTRDMLKARELSPKALQAVIGEDRKEWWRAVQFDPLLPEQLLPPGYRGKMALAERRRLHTVLGRSLDFNDLP